METLRCIWKMEIKGLPWDRLSQGEPCAAPVFSAWLGLTREAISQAPSDVATNKCSEKAKVLK